MLAFPLQTNLEHPVEGGLGNGVSGSSLLKRTHIKCCFSQMGMLKQKYHTLDDINNKRLYLTILEAGTFKINVPTDPVSGEEHFLV